MTVDSRIRANKTLRVKHLITTLMLRKKVIQPSRHSPVQCLPRVIKSQITKTRTTSKKLKNKKRKLTRIRQEL